jgi:hypothetical protein
METDESRDRELEAWLHSAYRSAPEGSARARERLRGALAMSPPPHRSGGVVGWLLEPVALRVRPALLLGSAAMLAVLAWFALPSMAPDGGRPVLRPGAQPAPSVTARRVDFTLIAPSARSVALVGDFNGWDLRATPLTRVHESGLWAVVLPVEPGRHLYGFVVDGRRWVCDPAASLSDDGAFGQRNSVLVVGNTL